jgi:hypothetical protein
MVAGLLGYLAVAAFFGVLNVLSGRPVLYTAALLGQAVTGGAADPHTLTIEPAAVLAYNAVHLVIFLAIGSIASMLVFATEKYPSAWALFLLIFVALLMVTAMAFSVLVGPYSAAMPWWALLGSNVLAALAVGAYILRRHPALWATVDREEA